jgi:cyclopropane fatty-acyl-phospholipid synthase-like methyltransferase
MDDGSEAGSATRISSWRRIRNALRDVWLTARRGLPEQRYAERTLKRMAAGKLRDTLGLEVRDEAATRKKAELWLEQMIELGLRPEHRCVEYGCGSLWCGEPVIRYLQPNRYVGLDVTDGFYEFGRQRLGSLLDERQVKLAIISRQSLAEVAALKPDFVFAHRVLHHVPPRGLARFVRSICSLLDERTVLVIENKPRPKRRENVTRARYRAADIEQYLPKDWICRPFSFGFLITHRDVNR